jgi:hypothetical protein
LVFDDSLNPHLREEARATEEDVLVSLRKGERKTEGKEAEEEGGGDGEEIFSKAWYNSFSDLFLEQSPDFFLTRMFQKLKFWLLPSRLLNTLRYKKASDYLDPVLSNIFSPTNTCLSSQTLQKFQTRSALVACAREVASRCTLSLFSVLPGLTEVLLMHVGDEYSEVAESARAGVKFLTELHGIFLFPNFPFSSFIFLENSEIF